MSVELQAGSTAPLVAALSDLSGESYELQLADIILDDEALAQLEALIERAGHPTRIVLVQDTTRILRAGVDVKAAVADRLSAVGSDLEVVHLPGEDPHTTLENIELVEDAIIDGSIVVAIGGGTVADVAKHAVHSSEARSDGLRLHLMVIQTANSVCAYSSGLSVLTVEGGVKRTVPSRLPDVLVLDATLLNDAPRHITMGGIGDASVAASSFADYRLSSLLGLGTWQPLSWELMVEPRTRFLRAEGSILDRGTEGAGRLGLDLAACGLSMTLAGDSAPLSGLEHVASHTLDMTAAHDGRPVGNHGSQCGLFTILTLLAWQHAIDHLDTAALDPARIDMDDEQAKVRAAFGDLDDDGLIWQECWKDYATKLDLWREQSPAVLELASRWDEYKRELSSLLVAPKDFVQALRIAGHPLRFEEIPTGITFAHARRAFTNARLMRKRSSIADLLGFAGQWNEATIDSIFLGYEQLVAESAR